MLKYFLILLILQNQYLYQGIISIHLIQFFILNYHNSSLISFFLFVYCTATINYYITLIIKI